MKPHMKSKPRSSTCRRCVLAVTFPIRGTIGFLSHPDLWRHVIMPTLCVVLVACVLLFVFFRKLFKPQDAYFVRIKPWDWHGTWDVVAFLLTAFVIVVEVLLPIVLVYFVFDSFVATRITAGALEKEGFIEKAKVKYGQQSTLFEVRAHEISGLKDLGPVRSAVHGVSFLLLRLPLWILATLISFSFPLMTPIVFPLLDGWAFTWSYLTDFLPIIGVGNCKDQAKFVRKYFAYFLVFGATTFLLVLIPFVGFLFLYGAAYGAALLFMHLIVEEEELLDEESRNRAEPLLTN